MAGWTFRLVDMLTRRRSLFRWGVAGGAALALVGGVAVGVGGSPVAAERGVVVEERLGPAALATVAPGTRTVQGIVVAIRPRFIRLRLPDDQTILIATPLQTKYRKAGSATERDALAVGQRLVVLGRTGPNGNLLARTIAIRAEPKAESVATPPPGLDAPLPVRSATPRPLRGPARSPTATPAPTTPALP